MCITLNFKLIFDWGLFYLSISIYMYFSIYFPIIFECLVKKKNLILLKILFWSLFKKEEEKSQGNKTRRNQFELRLP